jgi:hypothetical protein
MTTCRKKRYASYAQAQRALERVRDWRAKHHRIEEQKVERRSYYCARCKGHHLTTTEYRA